MKSPIAPSPSMTPETAPKLILKAVQAAFPLATKRHINVKQTTQTIKQDAND
jgi:hypothetical protein